MLKLAAVAILLTTAPVFAQAPTPTQVVAMAEAGAIANRSQYVMHNSTDVSTDLAAAQSRIVDTDYAAQTAALAKYNVLAQAGTIMLANPNGEPQSELQMLQD